MHQWIEFDTYMTILLLFVALAGSLAAILLFGMDKSRRMKAAGCRRPRLDRRRFR